MFPPLSRRNFVSRFVVGSVSSLLAGKIWSARVLGTLLDGPAGVLTVKVSDYPALLAEGGSIQLKFSGSTPHPLMINRGSGNSFYTLDSDCQHNHCVVPTFSPALGAIRCGCHGSRYAIDGSLLGGPATRGLNPFASAFDGVDTLRVTIPGLAFSVTEIALESAPAAWRGRLLQSGRRSVRRINLAQPTKRLRLKTNILPYSTFRVSFQHDLTAAPQLVPFATTPNGTANLTSAFTTTSPVNLYVDAATDRGFYTIELVATPY